MVGRELGGPDQGEKERERQHPRQGPKGPHWCSTRTKGTLLARAIEKSQTRSADMFRQHAARRAHAQPPRAQHVRSACCARRRNQLARGLPIYAGLRVHSDMNPISPLVPHPTHTHHTTRISRGQCRGVGETRGGAFSWGCVRRVRVDWKQTPAVLHQPGGDGASSHWPLQPLRPLTTVPCRGL